MGFFDKIFRRKDKPVTIAVEGRKTDVNNKFGIMAENQDRRVPAELNAAMMMLDEAFQNDEQFLTLSLEKPLYDGVYFVQAARIPSGAISVQVGIESEGGTKLVERLTDEVTCAKIMMYFLDTAKVESIDDYEVVKICKV
ncbi:MAG: hypothetical protein IJD85_09335 [Oscillospiraceae bacterium]|nr:hypothetical protein [Oscillospiraceae bacterium]